VILVRVTDTDGNVIYINADYIAMIIPRDGGTLIRLQNFNMNFVANESVDTILAQIPDQRGYYYGGNQ
jgi:hypothetical protein